jgi:hypothetical protein
VTRTAWLTLAVISLACAPAAAERPLSLRASAGASLHGWQPGAPEDVVRFDTEGLQALRLEASLNYRGRPLLGLQHSRSLRDTPRQEELLAAVGDRANGLTEVMGYVDLLALLAGNDRYRDGAPTFWRLLGAVRIVYYEDVYHVRTVAPDSFWYNGFDPPADPEDAIISDGEQLGFKTTFRDIRVLAPVWYDPLYDGAVARIGAFSSRWEKASQVEGVDYRGLPVVQDLRLETIGFTIAYENRLEHDGVGFALAMDLGLGGKGVESPRGAVRTEPEEGEATYNGLRGELRWNFRIGGRQGVATTLGGRFDLRTWRWSQERVERDILGQVFARVGFDLAL